MNSCGDLKTHNKITVTSVNWLCHRYYNNVTFFYLVYNLICCFNRKEYIKLFVNAVHTIQNIKTFIMLYQI